MVIMTRTELSSSSSIQVKKKSGGPLRCVRGSGNQSGQMTNLIQGQNQSQNSQNNQKNSGKPAEKPSTDTHCEVENHIRDHYIIKERLGKGAYGVVWEAVEKETGLRVALKKIYEAFRNDMDAQRTYREIIFLREFGSHPNIVSLTNIHRAENNFDIYLVFPLLYTDLFKLIKKTPELLTKHVIRSISYQILNSLKFIHSARVIHRDLKARSLTNPNPEIPYQALTDYVATRWYRPPEILLAFPKYTEGVDMWGFACIVVEMIQKKPLFPAQNAIEQLESIMGIIEPPEPEELEEIGSSSVLSVLESAMAFRKRTLDDLLGDERANGLGVNDLLNKLFVFNPAKRLSAEKAISHYYFRKVRKPNMEYVRSSPVTLPLSDFTQMPMIKYRETIYEIIASGETKSFRSFPNTNYCSSNSRESTPTKVVKKVNNNNSTCKSTPNFQPYKPMQQNNSSSSKNSHSIHTMQMQNQNDRKIAYTRSYMGLVKEPISAAGENYNTISQQQHHQQQQQQQQYNKPKMYQNQSRPGPANNSKKYSFNNETNPFDIFGQYDQGGSGEPHNHNHNQNKNDNNNNSTVVDREYSTGNSNSRFSGDFGNFSLQKPHHQLPPAREKPPVYQMIRPICTSNSYPLTRSKVGHTDFKYPNEEFRLNGASPPPYRAQSYDKTLQNLKDKVEENKLRAMRTCSYTTGPWINSSSINSNNNSSNSKSSEILKNKSLGRIGPALPPLPPKSSTRSINGSKSKYHNHNSNNCSSSDEKNLPVILQKWTSSNSASNNSTSSGNKGTNTNTNEPRMKSRTKSSTSSSQTFIESIVGPGPGPVVPVQVQHKRSTYFPDVHDNGHYRKDKEISQSINSKPSNTSVSQNNKHTSSSSSNLRRPNSNLSSQSHQSQPKLQSRYTTTSSNISYSQRHGNGIISSSDLLDLIKNYPPHHTVNFQPGRD